jgi:hypothetical protein
MTEFMITLRKADGSDGVGPARYVTFDAAAGPDRDLAQDAWTAALLATFPPAPQGPAGVRMRVGEILFLVHGFNVGHEAAREFHLQCVAGLARAGWTGQVISYDWPSDGLVFAYLPDRSNARAAASTLVTAGIALLERTQRQDCAINVDVLAHSMGAFVVQQAFTWSYQDVPAGWKIGQLMLAAADVDRTVFSAGTVSAGAFADHAARLTAYVNSYDKALLVSNAKRLDLAPRLGRVGLPDDAPHLMCEVDCSAVFAKAYPDVEQQLDPTTSHCFYFDQPEFWRDVVLTLGGGMDRSVIPTRLVDPQIRLDNRFILNPAGLDAPQYAVALARASVGPSIRL